MNSKIETRKKNIINWVVELQDESTISLLEFLHKRKNNQNIYELSIEEKQSIDQSLKSISERKALSHTQVMQNAKNKYPNLIFE
jgi:hypothetical protein